jgi:two-component system NtrC family sensor kinase
VPLIAVAWYSIVQFQNAIEGEHAQRLNANGREIEVIFSDHYQQLINNRTAQAASPQFTYNLSVGDLNSLNEITSQWIGNSFLSAIAVYNREGRRISLSYKNNGAIEHSNSNLDKIVLNEKYISHLYNKTDLGIINKEFTDQYELILLSKISSVSGKTLGYVEQKININNNFLLNIKNKTKVEIYLINENKNIIAGTIVPSLANLNQMSTEKNNLITDAVFELKNNKKLYTFVLHPIIWGQYNFQLAIGMDKKNTQSLLSNMNAAFVGLISLVVFLLLITIVISTSLLLKPIHELIDGLLAFEKTDSLVQLPVKNKTEIGLLTKAFNQMSYKIFQTRSEVKNKIKELELTNKYLKEAQTQLVHAAKMNSLGQLVAGVAHELNNPIGFIYSNTTHLKDYSEKLFKIIEETEKNPQLSEKIKQEYEFEYIKKDLPLLIKSCQDGAQRTRDIVVGLRNFSRIEESQLKEIDLHAAINTTLELLNGDIKNRIKIHRTFGAIPNILCFASQINQVVMNLLSNAIQAVGDNGQIWISTNHLKSANSVQNQVQFIIQDNGVGMSQDVLEKIFEPFFTTKNVGEGTGLGLSISYGIIQNHKGQIKVKSEQNVGTEFTVTMPVIYKK